MYTWGASPQLIRLLNQSRKRARMVQKCDSPKPAQSMDGGDRKPHDLPNGGVSAAALLTNEVENHQKPISMEANGSANHIENTEACDASESPKSFPSKLTAANLQDKIKNFLRSEMKQPLDKAESEAASKINSEFYLDDEYTDHFLPQQVDTGEVVGQIVQVGFLNAIHKSSMNMCQFLTYCTMRCVAGLKWIISQCFAHQYVATVYVGQKFGKAAWT